MSGKEHMIVGTTATATMGIGFLVTKTFDSFYLFNSINYWGIYRFVYAGY